MAFGRELDFYPLFFILQELVKKKNAFAMWLLPVLNLSILIAPSRSSFRASRDFERPEQDMTPTWPKAAYIFYMRRGMDLVFCFRFERPRS